MKDENRCVVEKQWTSKVSPTKKTVVQDGIRHLPNMDAIIVRIVDCRKKNRKLFPLKQSSSYIKTVSNYKTSSADVCLLLLSYWGNKATKIKLLLQRYTSWKKAASKVLHLGLYLIKLYFY